MTSDPTTPDLGSQDPAPTAPDDFDEHSWSRFLTQHLERPVRVTFGRARRQVIVAHTVREELRVRMNAFFSQAPPDVRDATARWLRAGRRARAACRDLDAWIAREIERQPAEERRRPKIRTRGRQHDLARLGDGLLAEEFSQGPEALSGSKGPPGITWGRRGRARRSILLGSYDLEHHLVRIHPVLDQPGVPTYFVRYVLFHELLHAAIRDDPERTGRKLHHGPRFRAREQAYPDYERALDWQERNLGALLRSARTGKDMSARRGRDKANKGNRPGADPGDQGWLFPC